SEAYLDPHPAGPFFPWSKSQGPMLANRPANRKTPILLRAAGDAVQCPVFFCDPRPSRHRHANGAPPGGAPHFAKRGVLRREQERQAHERWRDVLTTQKTA